MSHKLKELPLQVWDIVNTLKNNKSNLYSIAAESKDYIIKFVDNLPGEAFHFTLKTYSINGGKLHITIEMRPNSRLNTALSNFMCIPGQVEENFKRWVSLIEEYERLSHSLEDDNYEKYKTDFFDEIKSDSGDEYLSTEAQIKLDILLEVIERKLLAINNDKKNPLIEEIRNEVVELREKQVNYTKKNLAEKVAGILAKIKKAGINILRGFWDEGKKRFYKRIIDGTMDEIGGYIDTFSMGQ